MSPEPSTSTQNHEVCVDCTILQEEVCIEEAEIKRCRPLWVVSIYLKSFFFF